MNRIRLLLSGIVATFLAFVGMSTTVFASPFIDMTALNMGGNLVELYMSQNGSHFMFDTVNTSGYPVTCQLQIDTILYPKNNCNNYNFTSVSTSEYTLYIQLSTRNNAYQATVKYNPRLQRFTATGYGSTLPSTPPVNNSQGYLSISTTHSSLTLNQRTTLSLKLYNNNGTLDINSRDSVDLHIEKKVGSRYMSVSNSNYYLKSSRITLTAADRGSVTLTNWLSFTSSGNYRIVATNRRTAASSYQDFIVSSSNQTPQYGAADHITLELRSLRGIARNRYITTDLTIVDSYNQRVYDYRGFITFELQRYNPTTNTRSQAPETYYSLRLHKIYLGSQKQGYYRSIQNLRINHAGEYRFIARDSQNSSIQGVFSFTINE